MKKSDIRNSLKTSVLLGSFAFGIMSFILPVYTKRIGGNALTIGGLFSVFSVVTLILRPLIGKGTRHLWKKEVFCFGILVLCNFHGAVFLLNQYCSFVYQQIIQATGSSFMWISAYSIATDIAEERKRGSAIGQVDGAHSEGALYGAVIGFIILSNFTLLKGWSILFKVYAVLSIMAVCIALKYIHETRTVEGEINAQTDNGLDYNFFKLLCVVFIDAVSTSMLSPLLMIYLQDRFTTDIGTLAIAYIPTALVYAYLPSKLGVISDKVGRIIPIDCGLAGSGIASLSFTHFSSIEILAALWVLESIGIVVSSPAQKALVADIAGENIRGSAYGLYLFISSLGAAIGSLLGGWLYDSLGHAMPFYLNGIILLLDAILVAVLFKNYKKSSKHSITMA